MAIYYVYSGAAGSNNGSSWANAFTTLTTAFVTEAAGDTLYVAHDHVETSATAVTLTSSGTVTSPTKVVCVNRSGSVPPVSADRLATAQVATTGGTAAVTCNGFTHYDGIIFSNSNTGASAGFTLPGTSNQSLRFDNCSFRFAGSSGTATMSIGNLGTSTGTYVEFSNTTLSFGAVGQSVQISDALKWRNTPSALIGGTIPTSLFTPLAGRGALLELIGVDLSAAGSGKTLLNANTSTTFAAARVLDCKLNASVIKVSSAINSHGSHEIDFIRSGASGVNYTVSRYRISGTLDEEVTIVRTGGASDGTTPIAWRIVTTANCNYSLPFEAPPIAIWNDATGSAKTATVEGIWGGGAVPNDDDIWLDVEYLGDAASPQGSFVNDGKADLLATAAGQASSTAAWGGSTTKFKLDVSFTAQQKGWIYARVKCAKASSTFYVDPLITLT
jgi:hypothetical protein